jgi:hypothetical protein
MRIMHRNVVGAFAFWTQFERLAEPEAKTLEHAQGILHAMAESQFRNCRGIAFSPQDAEIFRRFGFEPLRTMEPGESVLLCDLRPRNGLDRPLSKRNPFGKAVALRPVISGRCA